MYRTLKPKADCDGRCRGALNYALHRAWDSPNVAFEFALTAYVNAYRCGNTAVADSAHALSLALIPYLTWKP